MFKSAISVIMIAFCLIIYTKLALVIAVFETLFLFVTYAAVWQYSLGPQGVFHEHYEQILNCVGLAELIVLIAGAPIDRCTVTAALSRNFNRWASDRRRAAGGKPGSRKDYRLPHCKTLEEI